MSGRRLFCFGLGFTALALARSLAEEGGWRLAGTCRTEEKRAELAANGIEAFLFERGRPLPPEALEGTTHLLTSVAPDEAGDPVLDAHFADVAALPGLSWIGYLSTTGVYGDWRGRWIDETDTLRPSDERSFRRVAAEAHWLDLWRKAEAPVHIFRLAGIYGPGRSQLDQVRNGTAKRILKWGQVFGRIHVDDAAQVLRASMDRPHAGRVYNVCDDFPAPPQDVIEYACALLGVTPPPAIPYEQAQAGMSEMARSFWLDNKRVRNQRIKDELGVRLRYPTYKEGLAAVLAARVN